MIVVFYNELADVCVYEFDGNRCEKVTCFHNPTPDYVESVIGITNDFLATVLLSIQDSFRGKRVLVFENRDQQSLYDIPEMTNTLFVYRKEIAVLQAHITEQEVKNVAEWMISHN